jgi:hypothetical protein
MEGMRTGRGRGTFLSHCHSTIFDAKSFRWKRIIMRRGDMNDAVGGMR